MRNTRVIAERRIMVRFCFDLTPAFTFSSSKDSSTRSPALSPLVISVNASWPGRFSGGVFPVCLSLPSTSTVPSCWIAWVGTRSTSSRRSMMASTSAL